jgi:hypothetical protein
MHTVLSPKTVALSFGIALALAACGGASSNNVATPAPSAVPSAPPTESVAPTVAAPAPTAAPPTAPAPTAAPPPTAEPSTPAPPTPTLAPLEANTIPDNGEFDDELPFNTTANDPAIGDNSGDGIANVTFQFFGPDEREIYSRTENNTLYCAFGGGDDGQDCDRWIFSEHQNQWPNGNPAQSGPHRLVVTIRGVRGGTATNERQATLNLIEDTLDPTPTLAPLEANTIPTDSIYGDELAFQTLANDPSAGDDNGAGIANVTFTIVNSQGDIVYEHTENNPSYCAFGGGDDGQDCNVWRFSEHNGAWPSGAPLENGGTYRLQATINARNGQQLTQELVFTIQL